MDAPVINVGCRPWQTHQITLSGVAIETCELLPNPSSFNAFGDHFQASAVPEVNNRSDDRRIGRVAGQLANEDPVDFYSCDGNLFK